MTYYPRGRVERVGPAQKGDERAFTRGTHEKEPHTHAGAEESEKFGTHEDTFGPAEATRRRVCHSSSCRMATLTRGTETKQEAVATCSLCRSKDNVTVRKLYVCKDGLRRTNDRSGSATYSIDDNNRFRL